MLLSAYSFDETGGTAVDYSGNGNSFLLGSNGVRVTGKNGGGLRPATTTAMTLPMVGGSSANRTVMMWLKGTIDFQVPLHWYNAAGTTALWGIIGQSGAVKIQARNATDVAQASATWDTTAWHHVAGTYDGATVRLYVDGALADSAVLPGPLRTDVDAVQMGGWNGTDVGFDDVRIYDVCLDGPAIEAAAAAPVVENSLAAHAALAVDVDFVARVKAAVLQEAVVIGQAVLDMESPSAVDKTRLILAQSSLADPASYGARFSWAVACDPDVDVTVDDAAVVEKVVAAWNLIAGVSV